MVVSSICFLIVLTMIVCKIFTGAAKVVALIAIGFGVLFMFADAGNLQRATIDIKKLKETNNEKTE